MFSAVAFFTWLYVWPVFSAGKPRKESVVVWLPFVAPSKLPADCTEIYSKFYKVEYPSFNAKDGLEMIQSLAHKADAFETKPQWIVAAADGPGVVYHLHIGKLCVKVPTTPLPDRSNELLTPTTLSLKGNILSVSWEQLSWFWWSWEMVKRCGAMLLGMGVLGLVFLVTYFEFGETPNRR